MPQTSQGSGHLQIAVRTASGTLPIEGAKVTLLQEGEILRVLTTDRSGSTEVTDIATPPVDQSLSPGALTPPYTKVLIEVDREGFYSAQYIDVPVFPDVLTVQTANLVPLPEYFFGSPAEGTQYFDESEGYDL